MFREKVIVIIEFGIEGTDVESFLLFEELRVKVYVWVRRFRDGFCFCFYFIEVVVFVFFFVIFFGFVFI